MNLPSRLLLSTSLYILISAAAVARAQGPLTPTGPPSPTMKSLSEIEPRRAIAALPCVITNGGSYYVVTNLDGISGTNGITIDADHVTLDLSGFALLGVSGSGHGIAVLGVRTNISIQNGFVRGWGLNGINSLAQSSVTLENLRVAANGNGFTAIGVGSYSRVIHCIADSQVGHGILVGQGSLVLDCIARGNGDHGIITGLGCTIQNCVVSGNFFGIGAGVGSSISGCTVSDNRAAGIDAANDSLVKDCTAVRNGGVGIDASARCVVIGCTANQNTNASFGGISVGEGSLVKDCTASRNNRDGIRLNSKCFAVGNVCMDNGLGTNSGAGIITSGTANRIESNNLLGNDWGLLVGSTGNFIARNSASGNGTNYLISATQTIGPIITATGTITNNNPWANFEY